MGRPTLEDPLYDPDAMIPIIIDMMNDGASIVEVCAAMKLRRATWYDWLKDDRKPEFKEAVAMGELLSQAWWERQGRINLHADKFATALWIINMKNRFKNDWKDKQEVETYGKDGAPLHPKTTDISDAELDARILELTAKDGKKRTPEAT